MALRRRLHYLSVLKALGGVMILLLIMPTMMPMKVASESPKKSLTDYQPHPCLFFDEIAEIPGVRYENLTPYKSWKNSIIRYSDRSLLRWNPSRSDEWELFKAQNAKFLALTYLLTNNTKYAEKCKEILEYYGKGVWRPEDRIRWVAKALIHYAIAYDWITNYLRATDPEFENSIRSKLVETTTIVYNEGKTAGNWHDRYNSYCALGVAALALADYEPPSSSKGPVDWLEAGVTWLCECEPYSGKSVFAVSCNLGGLYLCYSYETYFLPELWIWLNAYNHYYNRSLAENYPIVRKFLNTVIWLSLPNGMGPNYVTAGNTYWGYSYYMLNVLPEPDMRWHMWFIKSFLGVDGPRGPYDCVAPRISIPVEYVLWLFLLYDKYAVEPEPPEWTTFISAEAESAVFRNKWAPDA
ncbi:MAG: hypothetical protein DRO43_05190, partial [Candidatus Hecatellales archaeon]